MKPLSKSFREMHREAWKAAVSKWSFRMVTVIFIFSILTNLALYYPIEYFKQSEAFQWAQQTAQLVWKLYLAIVGIIPVPSDLNFTLPTSQQLLDMSWSAMFLCFVFLLAHGLTTIGVVTVANRAIRDKSEGWFSSSFSGFKDPLGMGWLTLLRLFLILLLPCIITVPCAFLLSWLYVTGCPMVVLSLLFVVVMHIITVAVIYIYLHFAFAMYIKSDNLGFSAWRCLRESSRMIHGHKLWYLLYWLTYIGWMLLPVAVFVHVALFSMVLPEIAGLLMGVFMLVYMFVRAYTQFGWSAYYNELKRLTEYSEKAVNL